MDIPLAVMHEVCRSGRWSGWLRLITSPLPRDLARTMVSRLSEYGYEGYRCGRGRVDNSEKFSPSGSSKLSYIEGYFIGHDSFYKGQNFRYTYLLSTWDWPWSDTSQEQT